MRRSNVTAPQKVIFPKRKGDWNLLSACVSFSTPQTRERGFHDLMSAEKAGFRPCKRCQPDSVSPLHEQTEMIARACREIEESDAALSLEELASQANLSPWHFYRLFKQTVGVTPKQYATTLTNQILRTGLSSDASHTNVTCEAGFGSDRPGIRVHTGESGDDAHRISKRRGRSRYQNCRRSLFPRICVGWRDGQKHQRD